METGRLRLITSMANTARCLGVPNDTGVPSMLICSGPSTPKPRLFAAIRPIVTAAARRRRDFSYAAFAEPLLAELVPDGDSPPAGAPVPVPPVLAPTVSPLVPPVLAPTVSPPVVVVVVVDGF